MQNSAAVVSCSRWVCSLSVRHLFLTRGNQKQNTCASASFALPLDLNMKRRGWWEGWADGKCSFIFPPLCFLLSANKNPPTRFAWKTWKKSTDRKLKITFIILTQDKTVKLSLRLTANNEKRWSQRSTTANHTETSGLFPAFPVHRQGTDHFFMLLQQLENKEDVDFFSSEQLRLC